MTPEERAFAAAAAVQPTRTDQPPPAKRRLSALRVLGSLLALVVVIGGIAAYRASTHATYAAVPASSFMPYVDVTATPTFSFEDPARAAANVALGFVVSSPQDACQPSWGAAYSLDGAAAALDLDRRIARTRQRGGDVAVSFGGAANDELSIRCTDPDSLATAYSAVIARYSLDMIDLDIEGAAASAPDVSARRAQAILSVQQAQKQAGHDLAVWLTLPVSPTGLAADGLAVLQSMLSADVVIAGVNGMTMDYGNAMPAGQTMFQASQSALTGLAHQLVAAYGAAGEKLTAEQAWQRIGATPMIGQNDVADEIFGLSDASQLLDFAQSQHIRRISMWSSNRDQPCGPNYANVEIVSTNCSGIDQEAGAFTTTFAPFTASDGPVQAGASTSTSASAAGSPTAGAAPGASSTAVVDDPAQSPYQIWSPVIPYAKGTKVVWHRNVYEAKWWTLGDTPDAPVASASDTPWTLIGPVLPGEHPSPTPTLSAGTYPQWSADQTYVAGQRVMYQGLGYQAKWYTHGDVPGVVVSDPGQTPWEYITSP